MTEEKRVFPVGGYRPISRPQYANEMRYEEIPRRKDGMPDKRYKAANSWLEDNKVLYEAGEWEE